MDALLSVAEQAIDRVVTCNQYRRDFMRMHNCDVSRAGFGINRSGHFLRPILPLLDLHGGKTASDTIDYVAREVGRVMSELATWCVTIRQFAEHNWSMAENLFDTLAEGGGAYADNEFGEDFIRTGIAKRRKVPGCDLARDKRVVAEVEDAVCDRIDALIGMAAVLPTEANGDDNGTAQSRELGLDDVCLADAFDLATDKETGRFIPMWE
eukprot:13276949-Ditylum_brightwellii.AAC.1